MASGKNTEFPSTELFFFRVDIFHLHIPYGIELSRAADRSFPVS
jgi:hypothetical protein